MSIKYRIKVLAVICITCLLSCKKTDKAEVGVTEPTATTIPVTRLKEVLWENDKTIHNWKFLYNNFGYVTEIAYYIKFLSWGSTSTQITSFEYNENHKIIRKTVKDPPSPIFTYNYSYNTLGQLIQVEETVDNEPTGKVFTFQWTNKFLTQYNKIHTGTSNAIPIYKFTYNSDENLSQVFYRTSAQPNFSLTYDDIKYDASNSYLSYAPGLTIYDKMNLDDILFVVSNHCINKYKFTADTAVKNALQVTNTYNDDGLLIERTAHINNFTRQFFYETK